MIRTAIAISISVLTIVPAMAQSVVDYRDGSVLDIADPKQWTSVANSIGENVEVLGEVSGSLALGREHKVYLATNYYSQAGDTGSESYQYLVMFEGDLQVGMLELPEHTFSRPVSMVDLNGDGVDEVVLEGSFYNMGTLAIGLSAVELGEVAEIIQTLPNVFVDSCEAPVGEQAVTASVVSVSDGQLVAEPETLDCP